VRNEIFINSVSIEIRRKTKMLKNIQTKYIELCQSAATKSSPSSQKVQLGLFALGVVLLSTGIAIDAAAQYTAKANYNDARMAESADVIFTYLNGSFGALVMVASGIGAIISGAFGQYRASLGLMVVAVGSFIVRSLVSTWFNDISLQGD
jgi:hypothetical protein